MLGLVASLAGRRACLRRPLSLSKHDVIMRISKIFTGIENLTYSFPGLLSVGFSRDWRELRLGDLVWARGGARNLVEPI